MNVSMIIVWQSSRIWIIKEALDRPSQLKTILHRLYVVGGNNSCIDFCLSPVAVYVLLSVSAGVCPADRLVRRGRTRTRPSGTGVPTAARPWPSCTRRTTGNCGATDQPSPTPGSVAETFRYTQSQGSARCPDPHSQWQEHPRDWRKS